MELEEVCQRAKITRDELFAVVNAAFQPAPSAAKPVTQSQKAVTSSPAAPAATKAKGRGR